MDEETLALNDLAVAVKKVNAAQLKVRDLQERVRNLRAKRYAGTEWVECSQCRFEWTNKPGKKSRCNSLVFRHCDSCGYSSD